MTSQKKSTAIIAVLSAVFLLFCGFVIYFAVTLTVNNSRLVDYIVDNRVNSVTYSRFGDNGLLLTSYLNNSEKIATSGARTAVSGDLELSKDGYPNGDFSATITNNFAQDGTIKISCSVDTPGHNNGYLYAEGSYSISIISASGGAAIYSVSSSTATIDLGKLINEGKIVSGVTYNINFYGREAYGNNSPPWPEEYSGSGTVCTFKYMTTHELPPTPSKTGYTFTGWYTDKECQHLYTDTKVVGDINLYAGFRPNTYTIHFNANNSNGEMADLPMVYDTAKNLPVNTFEKEHYAFKGWALEPTGEVKYDDQVSVNNLVATDNGEITLYAIFERSEWVVTYDVDGTKTTGTVPVNSSISLPQPEPSKEGYNFIGWTMPDGSIYTDQPVTQDITLTAKFEIIRCRVTFYLGDDVYGVYECDYGTNLSELLLSTGVNPVLYKIASFYEPVAQVVTSEIDVPIEKTAIGGVVSEQAFWPIVVGIGVFVLVLIAAIVYLIVLAVKKNGKKA